MKKPNRIIVDNIKIPASSTDEEAIDKALKILDSRGISFNKNSARIHKKSVDARRKNDISFVISVCAETDESIDKIPKIPGIRCFENEETDIKRGKEKPDGRPYIIGFGPAGMFCALLLCKYGMPPVILERGCDVDERSRRVESFYNTGVLDTETNIQFGAGGAGTFSDGKLVTRIGDSRTEYVLSELNLLGAPDDILYRAKPHVGTDILKKVVKNAAEKIISMGGEIRYNTKAEEIRDKAVKVGGVWEKCACVVLAPGHSARDLYKSLSLSGFAIEAKPFSVGVRIEHLQRDIDRAMYGDEALAEKLGHAEYHLSQRQGERGVYTFCMCPGGSVVAAASEEGGVVTNGMSRHSRDGLLANAAVAVSVLPEDFGNTANGAVDFQRKLERAAYAIGKNYYAPCQSVGNFYMEKEGGYSDKIPPSYMNSKVVAADFNKLLPPFAVSMLKMGISSFGKKIKGFDNPKSPLTGIETRTSAPVRILRNENLTALGKNYVYPCGEGAGYAGGITSAAVDGLRVAQAILERFGE